MFNVSTKEKESFDELEELEKGEEEEVGPWFGWTLEEESTAKLKIS